MTPEQKMERGERAQELLNNGLLKETLQAVEQRTVEKLKACPIKDVEQMKALVTTLQYGQVFERQLKSYIDDGLIEKEGLLSKLRLAK